MNEMKELVLNQTNLESPLIKGFPCMNEMKTMLLQCILSDYLPWYYRSLPKKCVLNQTNLGFPFIRAFPCMNEMKKLVLNQTNCGFPLIRGFPPMNEMKTFL